ncbi:transport protein particle 20 kDa subunit [Suhomyces tanzawaensis NRRL Y-17324]|uniref:Transport protein particle 20 kDa subunit n=1 Tax=Suhomyces tanzawaensis NRRL Y-17324 TaxID=984487 RepID=A0A1E4SDM5_9ASCO|nr:transport protein particle 20 kDa subunit [Suhomyces tanzawaensis NRRL Y-17324]ODV77617.1 transport protein particle 20 kDa subunit [Suhomyces tanzawaensis NRRL Y-17324]
MTSYYFSIIGTRDNPVYEFEFSSFKNSLAMSTSTSVPGKSQFSASIKEMLPFISNSSLDIIEDAQWTTNLFYLGKIDSFYGLLVNAFITQGNIKFVLCYDVSNGTTQKYDDSSIKQFFIEANDLYVKCLLNPFYSVNDAIVSPDFDLRLKLIAKKYL